MAPDPQYEVWTRGETYVTQNYFRNGVGTFEANIGDIVGIFLSIETRSELTSGTYAYVYAYAWLEFWADNRCHADFSKDRTVNFKDLAVLANYWLMQN